MVLRLVEVRVSRELGREVVATSTLLVVDTMISVSVEEIREMREPRLVLAAASVTVLVTVLVLMATPLLETGVPLLQVTPLSF